jgi:hypothetical protein
MWSSEPQIIELTKGERGLGFSILDYQVRMGMGYAKAPLVKPLSYHIYI